MVSASRLPPVCPRFDSQTWRHMWVEFVVGSRPCSEGFSPGSPVFLPPQKSTLLNSNSIWKQWMKSHFVEMPLQISVYFYFIHLNRLGTKQGYSGYNCIVHVEFPKFGTEYTIFLQLEIIRSQLAF